MDRVIFPEAAAVEQAMQPIEHEVRQNQEQHTLEPQRQLGQRAMAVVVKRDERVGIMDSKDDSGAEDEESNPQYAREQRNEEPVTDVGDEFAFAPPWLARIAGPEMRQEREGQSQHDRDGNYFGNRLAEHLDDFQG